jgi:hypothetical protein
LLGIEEEEEEIKEKSRPEKDYAEYLNFKNYLWPPESTENGKFPRN